MAASIAASWSADVFREMRAREIKTVCTIPDGGLTELLNMVDADRGMRLVTLSTEEEGIGIATGQWLGGMRAMVAMQSSGIGNCINALGLPTAFPMGQAVRPALEAVGVKCFPVDKAEEVGEVFAAAADMAFHGLLSAAVLVSQRVIGAKGFGQK
jgi:sulfopyruvate decarboxylase TPP-binding subunit